MSNNHSNHKILDSKQKILDYIGCSKYVFRKYIEAGLPARYEDKRWIAYTDNIDEFFKSYTRVSMKSVLSSIPEDD